MNCLYLLVLALLLAVTSVTASTSCKPGKLHVNNECIDYDECENEPGICGKNSVCHNTNGSYYCQCEPGYKTKSFNFTAGQGLSCKDINECVDNKNICGPNAVCSNSIGSYYCSCASGFVASNGQELFNTSQRVTCKETKNTSEDKTQCAPDGVCYKMSVYCTNTVESSAVEQQQFKPTLLTFLPVSHWILMIYQ